MPTKLATPVICSSSKENYIDGEHDRGVYNSFNNSV